MTLPKGPPDAPPSPRGGAATQAAEQARAACAARDWPAAFACLTDADRAGVLAPEELELLAECARWVGRGDVLVDPLERAHRTFAERDDARGAARTALALGHANLDLGAESVAKSWFARASELLEDLPEGAEHAIYTVFRSQEWAAQGEFERQAEAAQRGYEIACRSGDRSAEALTLIERAHALSARGRVDEARADVERATALAVAGETGHFATGSVFCSAIWIYRCLGEWGRALEWTETSDRWVDRERVAYFPGLCRVHRSEVLRVRGELAAAEHESREAARCLAAVIPRWAVVAEAELGEVLRRRGDHEGAMRAFQNALAHGWDPQPGLALLLLAREDVRSAHSAIERAFVARLATWVAEDRASLLAARTRIAIAAGELDIAESAAERLAAAADDSPSGAAAAAHAAGEVAAARGRHADAVAEFSRARALWADVGAPYELARTRTELGLALAAGGDRVGAQIELGAAERAFERIGAAFDRRRAAALLADLAAGGGPPTSSAAATEASLVRQGEYWSFTFEERVVNLRDGRGPQYLAALLARPGVAQWAIDLAAPGAPRGGSAPADVLDEEARAAYRRRLRELQEDLDDARARNDEAAVEPVLTEMDQLGRALAAAIGLGGRVRRTPGAVERARQSVTKAIRGALRKLAAEHPSLGRYLDSTISTGTACTFEPDPRFPVQWHVDPGAA